MSYPQQLDSSLIPSDKEHDDHYASGPQCAKCEEAMFDEDVTIEREHGDELCIPCRKRKADKVKEDRIADFCEGCGPAMNAILDVIFPVVEHWEVDDLVGDLPWRLQFKSECLDLLFSRPDSCLTLWNLSEDWAITFGHTTPPFIVYMAIKAAVDAGKKTTPESKLLEHHNL